MLDNGLGSSLPYVRGLNIQQQEKPKDLSGAFLSLAARSRHRNVRSVGRYWPVVPDQGELPNPYASKDPNPKNMVFSLHLRGTHLHLISCFRVCAGAL